MQSPPKTYAYLRSLEFTGVNKDFRPPTGMGSPRGQWTFYWDGIHPKTPWLEHQFCITEAFDHIYDGATHEITIRTRFIDQDSSPIDLYIVQIDLREFVQANEVAEQLLCALVLYLLRCRNPRAHPGVATPPIFGQRSTWSIVLQETMRGIFQQEAPNI
jgi:hypothetical protein